MSRAAYVYMFHSGMVSFFNFKTEEIETIFRILQRFYNTPIADKLQEPIAVFITPNKMMVTYHHLVLPQLKKEMIGLVTLNISQTVALDRYSQITEDLLIETDAHTSYLERKGKLLISGNTLKRFIGRMLNIKNKISENLYSFDLPDITWDNEDLNKLNQGLKQVFDLKDRYRLIYDRIEIIK
ncbi:RMD1 family protein [Bizionia gelidisalsuginis]|uniref:RMD1 family protein n=1 Tax=Bizionia gelidisalsuginis TaxID=291188 RepID=UPI001FEACF81|nr:RMD1 family protein [Bizionia gelidisalsuginis]